MKKVSISVICMCFMSLLFAQEETLVGKGIESGGYGGPVYKIGMVNGRVGMFSGGRGAWIINHTFAIGGGGYNSLFDVKTDQLGPTGKPLYLDISYSGLEMEYIHDSDKLIHWTVHVLLGGGSVNFKEHDPNESIDSDRFFLIEPSMNVDINIIKWFRIGFGASYRAAFGVDMEQLSDSDIGGITGSIVLKFGTF